MIVPYVSGPKSGRFSRRLFEAKPADYRRTHGNRHGYNYPERYPPGLPVSVPLGAMRFRLTKYYDIRRTTRHDLPEPNASSCPPQNAAANPETGPAG